MKREFLFVAHTTDPFLSVYDAALLVRIGQVNITGGNPANTGNGCAFNHDGSLLAVAHNISPYLTVYDTSDWSKVSLTGGNPPDTGRGCAFNHDGSLLAVAHNSSPYLTVYDTSDWSKVSLIGGNPPDTGLGCSFSPPIGGTISNRDTTPITDALNVPVSRRVFALRRSDGAALADMEAGLDGRYELPILLANEPVTVLFQADNDLENSVVVDWVDPSA